MQCAPSCPLELAEASRAGLARPASRLSPLRTARRCAGVGSSGVGRVRLASGGCTCCHLGTRTRGRQRPAPPCPALPRAATAREKAGERASERTFVDCCCGSRARCASCAASTCQASASTQAARRSVHTVGAAGPACMPRVFDEAARGTRDARPTDRSRCLVRVCRWVLRSLRSHWSLRCFLASVGSVDLIDLIDSGAREARPGGASRLAGRCRVRTYYVERARAGGRAVARSYFVCSVGFGACTYARWRGGFCLLRCFGASVRRGARREAGCGCARRLLAPSVRPSVFPRRVAAAMAAAAAAARHMIITIVFGITPHMI